MLISCKRPRENLRSFVAVEPRARAAPGSPAFVACMPRVRLRRRGSGSRRGDAPLVVWPCPVRLSPEVTPSQQAQRSSSGSPAAGMSRNRRLAAHAAGNIRCQLVAGAAKQSSLDWRRRGRPNEYYQTVILADDELSGAASRRSLSGRHPDRKARMPPLVNCQQVRWLRVAVLVAAPSSACNGDARFSPSDFAGALGIVKAGRSSR